MDTASPTRPAIRKKQILAEAARLIGERGYFGFGLQELADRCGITKPGVLHHFGSKEQLLVELLRERDHHASILVTALQGPACFAGSDMLTRQGVLDTLRAIVAQSAAQPEMLRLYAVLSLEALNPRHPAHAFFNAREAATRELFAQMLVPHVAAPKAVALHVVAAIKGLEQEWLRTPGAFDLLEEWDAIVEGILA